MNNAEKLYQAYIAEDKKTGDPQREHSLSTIELPKITLQLAFDQELGPEHTQNGQRSARVKTELPLKHAAKMFSAVHSMAYQHETVYMTDRSFLEDKLTRMGMTMVKKEDSMCIYTIPKQLLTELVKNGFEIPGVYKGGPVSVWTGTPEESQATLRMQFLEEKLNETAVKIYEVFSQSAGTEEHALRHMRNIDDAVTYLQEEYILECMRNRD